MSVYCGCGYPGCMIPYQRAIPSDIPNEAINLYEQLRKTFASLQPNHPDTVFQNTVKSYYSRCITNNMRYYYF